MKTTTYTIDIKFMVVSDFGALISEIQRGVSTFQLSSLIG